MFFDSVLLLLIFFLCSFVQVLISSILSFKSSLWLFFSMIIMISIWSLFFSRIIMTLLSKFSYSFQLCPFYVRNMFFSVKVYVRERNFNCFICKKKQSRKWVSNMVCVCIQEHVLEIKISWVITMTKEWFLILLEISDHIHL